ncbi:MAG: anthranilate phosphoribosyltransferase [Gammaproteobacteria bacterium]|nr:MAG: anthranilate phosphoribosyltransferase [Gammaproteobacteria bacterium]
MDIKQAIAKVSDRGNLTDAEMRAAMGTIMRGEATPAQIGGFLIALRMKGETVEEIAAAATVMRELSARVTIAAADAVDIVGTGGDGSGTFNISTVAALVVAAAGGRVAKHGNRAASSPCGSADLLEAAGVNIELTPDQVGVCVDRAGIGFMFAARHHGAMRHAAAPRRELGVRTILNVLGPLTNPAGVKRHLIGVYAPHLVENLARVLQRLGSERALIVHAEDGLDEISCAAPTQVAELAAGEVQTYRISPEDFGIPTTSLADLRVENVTRSLELIRSVLDNRPGPARDIVLLNAGAALYVAGQSNSIKTGVQLASDTLASGAAKKKLDELAALSQSFEASKG